MQAEAKLFRAAAGKPPVFASAMLPLNGGRKLMFASLCGSTSYYGPSGCTLSGFAAEGDWKTAALLRTVKVMAHGLPGGTSFMEDYTYDFTPGNELVIGAHMLEVCPSIADDARPQLDAQPLSIGGKADPARLLFSARPGRALNASLIDMGNRFRLIVNAVETVKQPQPLPKLPVARAVWKALPNLDVAAEAWILAGGAHHTVYTQSVTDEHLRILADIFGIEFLLIDEKTTIPAFKNEICWNEVAFGLRQP